MDIKEALKTIPVNIMLMKGEQDNPILVVQAAGELPFIAIYERVYKAWSVIPKSFLIDAWINMNKAAKKK